MSKGFFICIVGNLDLALPVPVGASGFRTVLDGIHEQFAQAVAALQVGFHNFKSNFIHAGAALKHLGATVFSHSHGNVKQCL